jgi:UDP-glucuronate 4-epimerase
MVLFLFTNAILASEPKDAHNRGNMVRDFTYTDDIIEGVAHIVAKTPKPNPEWDGDTLTQHLLPHSSRFII